MLDMSNQKSLSVPIRTDKGGTLRVGDSRVTLLSVLNAFEQGNTPEQIVHSFPTLKLADVYAVVTYYLNNRKELDDWLKEERGEGARILRETEARFPQTGIRERLLARKINQGS